MKRFFLSLLLFVVVYSSYAQFSDTASLNAYIRDTIRDRKPDKVTAAQLQKALLGLSGLTSPKDTIKVKKAIIFDSTANQLLATPKIVDTSTFTMSKTGYNWNARPVPIQLYHVSQNGYDIMGSNLISASKFYNVDTFRQATWGVQNFLGYVYPTAEFSQVLRFRGGNGDPAMFQPSYGLVTDAWRGLEGARVNGTFGRKDGTTGTFRTYTMSNTIAQSAYRAFFVYMDMNNGGPARYDGLYSAIGAYYQQSKSDTTQNVRFFTTTSSGYGSGGPGAGTRNIYGYYAEPIKDRHLVDRAYAFYNESANDRNYFAGPTAIGDTSLVNQDVHIFYVNGSSKFNGNIFFDSYSLKSGDENDQYLTTDANGQLKLKTTTTSTYPGNVNQVFYKNSSGTIGASSDLTFDSTNIRLGLGLGTGFTTLDATLKIVSPSPADQSTSSGLSATQLVRIYGSNGGSTSYTSATGTIIGGAGGSVQFQSGNGGQNTGASTTAKGGPGALFQTGSGNGGNQTNSSAVNGTGGAGGETQMYGGNGGTARGTGTITGGAGGRIWLYAGSGGAAQGSTGTRNGGVGGDLVLWAGGGGTGVNSGGTGGNVEIYSGSGGNVGGVAGNIYLYPGITSSSYGNIFLGINRSGNIGGSVGIGTNSFVSGEKLRVNGNAVVSGTLTSNSFTTSGAVTATYLNMSSPLTPSSSADATGSIGDVRYDDNYIYIKTSAGWKRSSLGTW